MDILHLYLLEQVEQPDYIPLMVTGRTVQKFTRLSGPLGKDHFNAYREGNGNIYVKTTTQSEPLTVTSVGSNHVFKFEESDKDVDSLIVLQ